MTLGLCLIGAVPFLRGGLVFIAQMLGAMASAAVVSCLFPGPLAVTTSLSGGTSKTQGLFIEMVGLSYAVCEEDGANIRSVPHRPAGFHHIHACCEYIRPTVRSVLTPAQAEKHKGTFLAPVGIGLSLFIAELAGRSMLVKIPQTWPG